ncbi:MAG: minor extracellular serine protease Vpr [Acidimicrobiaceae bacterium]
MRYRRSGRKLIAACAATAVAVTLLATSTGAVPGQATPDGDGRASYSIDGRHVNFSGVDRELLPALMSTGDLTVMVETAGDPVARKRGAARRQGRELSTAEQSTARAQVKANQDRVKSGIEAAGGQVLTQIQDAYSGMRVRINRSKVVAIASLAGVVGVHALKTYKHENVNGVQYVNGDDVWQTYGNTGEGTTIAIIDTGIDYFHANFGGNGNPATFANDNTTKRGNKFPTDKVIEGWDFVGDAYDADGTGDALVPHPDPDPLDCAGHGSHVAGSAAGLGVLEDGSTYAGPYDNTTYSSNFQIGPGVAPGAKLLAYRVFGCDGSTNVVVEAINQAIVDGADVINMSLGSAFGAQDNPDVVAVENATAAGVVVVASAGNETAIPYVTGSPAVADHAISVAAVDAMPSIPTANIALSGPSADVQAINANDATIPGGGITADLLVLPDGAGGISLGCDESEYAGAAGKIVVTKRGTCARVDRATFGQNAGAVTVVMVNNADSLPPFEGDIEGGVTIPFLGVPSSDGDEFLSRDGTSATITDTGDVANPAYQVLADFTSGGPRSGDSGAKPDVTAPGVSVNSTAMGTGTKGTYLSGTSMAAPHTAGVAALVVEQNPDWTPPQVRAAIINTANPDVITDPDPRLAGTGAVDASRAVNSPVLAMTENEGASLSFGYEQINGAFAETKQVVVSNFGDVPVNFSATVTPTEDTGDYSLSVSPSVFTVPAASGGFPGQTTTAVTISMTAADAASLPPSSFELTSRQGAVTFEATSPGSQNLRLAYMFVPRATSDVVVEPSAAVTAAGTSRSVDVKNRGVHSSDVFLAAWTHSDPADTPGEAADVRAVGVSVMPAEFLDPRLDFLSPNDRSILFAVNSWNRWSNPSGDVEFDFGIDTKGSAAPDYYVFGFDLGSILADTIDGNYASFILDKNFDIVDIWLAFAPLNGSTLILPAAASDLGLSQHGRTKFRITDVTGFSLQDGSVFDAVSGNKPYVRVWNPTLTQGEPFSLDPGESTSAELEATSKAKTDKLLGWLFISFDDKNGPAQADAVTLPGKKPKKGSANSVAA